MAEEMRSGDYPAYPNNADPSGYGFAFGLGMSKREHYAALFLAGMCANSAISLGVPPQDLARVAITQADVLVAMLAEADRGDA